MIVNKLHNGQKIDKVGEIMMEYKEATLRMQEAFKKLDHDFDIIIFYSKRGKELLGVKTIYDPHEESSENIKEALTNSIATVLERIKKEI